MMFHQDGAEETGTQREAALSLAAKEPAAELF